MNALEKIAARRTLIIAVRKKRRTPLSIPVGLIGGGLGFLKGDDHGEGLAGAGRGALGAAGGSLLGVIPGVLGGAAISGVSGIRNKKSIRKLLRAAGLAGAGVGSVLGYKKLTEKYDK